MDRVRRYVDEVEVDNILKIDVLLIYYILDDEEVCRMAKRIEVYVHDVDCNVIVLIFEKLKVTNQIY